ncbi:MAG: carboxypeptidase-like regulatory domain-containing protein [Terracidiphilus sp.]
MAGAKRSWTKALAVTVLCGFAGLGQAAAAQDALDHSRGSGAASGLGSGSDGVIAGKLTDLHSAPLDGVTVVVRNEATGAEARTTTARNGSYRFTGLDAGEYTLEAESAQLGRGRLEGIFVAAGHEARVQTAIQFEIPTANSIQVASHELAPVRPVEIPPVAAKPEKQLAMSGLGAPELTREMPATVTPRLAATVVAEPLQTLSLSGRRMSEEWRDKPEVATLALNATVSTEPLRELSLAGRRRPDGAQPILMPVAPVLIATLAAEPLLTLSLDGRPWPATARQTSNAAAQIVDPVTPVVTTTVSAAQLQALPVSGRRWQDFVLDAPTAATPAGGTSQTSLRGAGQEPVENTVDGASIRLAFGGSGGSGPGSSGPGANGQGGSGQNGMGQAWAGGHGAAVAEAAIREVETAAGNVEAAGARAAGGRMNVQTERGENGLHGQGFVFDRQNTWGAQNPFTQWITETSEVAPLAPFNLTQFPVFDNFQYSSGQGGPPQSYTPPDHETVWGVGLGSQIRRDKLFWFAALDSYHRNDPGLSMVKHPYLLQSEPSNTCANPPCTETTGFFAQPSDDQMQVLCTRLELIEPGQTGQPKACTNALAQGLGAYSPMLEALAGLLGPAPRTATQWTGFGRLDWQAAERHRFTLEGIGATWNSPGGGLTRVSENYGNHSFGSSQASEEWLLGRWEAFLTPNLLAVTQSSLGQNILSARPETPSDFEKTFLAGSAWGRLPQIVVDNRYGFTIGNPSRFGQGSYPGERLYQAQESVDWIRSSLLVKAGFDLSHNFDATSLLRNQTGTYTYSNVENFVSDALAFAAFGIAGQLNPYDQHNCDQTGKIWTDPTGTVRGLGALPCYSYYSQVMGPTNWHLSTNDWAGFATAQWQPGKLFVVSAGLRWEREQLPPPIAALWPPPIAPNSPAGVLPPQGLPGLGNNWGPRVSLAVGNSETHWPVLRLGYGMYFGRVENATVETALTQTGSPNGDQSFFIRPTDGLKPTAATSDAPPFPYVLIGPPASEIKPDAVEFAPNFHNPEVHQAVTAVEETLPGHVQLTAGAMVSLGRRLPISIDTNFDPKVNPGSITYGVVDATGMGPIKTAQITVPFYASWPSANSPTGFAGRLNADYQQISEIMSRANSTYEAGMLKVTRYGRRGLSLHAHYTYSHAMDWNPNESTLVAGSDVLDPANFSQEYGTSNLDMRHSAAAMVIYEAPWKFHNLAGRLANGWMVSGIGSFRSGLPYTMRTSGSLAEEFTTTGTPIVGLGPGMNGSGGDNRVYGVGRNTYRYPATWKADMRAGKSFDLGQMWKVELLVESFNLFNHQNVTELETTGYYLEPGNPSGGLPTLNFMTGPVTETNGTIVKANSTAFGQPLNVNATNFYRERQIQVGLRMRF